MLKHVHNVKLAFDKGQNVITNPLDFFLDWIVRIVSYIFIPIPLAAEVLRQYRGMIFAFLLNGVLLVIVLLIVIVGVFTNPLLTKNVRTNIALPSDGSFISTDIPLQNPLGGVGLSMVKISAEFMDPDYAFFGGVHTGVDFVPSDLYYQSNTTYKSTGDVVVYETINGKVKYYVDQYGSNTVEITNKDNSIKTINMHLNKVFVSTGDTATAGKPLGTMGDTGISTGDHLHYEIRVNNNGKWTPVNPLGYIQ
jgi:murein DD-endopeptidase MepM/ murein hydrolase activator NlpD